MEAYRIIHSLDEKSNPILQIRKYIPRKTLAERWIWQADEIVCKKLSMKDLQMKEKYPEAFVNRKCSIHNKKLTMQELRKLKLEKLLS